MATVENNLIPQDILADDQAIIDHLISGKPLDPEVARRIRERGQRITDELRRQYGVLDIGVPAIRELRDSP